MCQVPGFVTLQWLLQSHCHIAEIYYMLVRLLDSQTIMLPSNSSQVNTANKTMHRNLLSIYRLLHIQQ